MSKYIEPDKLLVDTSVLLEDPDVLSRIFDRGGVPFLSNTILQELDFNKSGAEEINRNSRYLFRELTRTPAVIINSFPDGRKVQDGDQLSRLEFKGKWIFILSRTKHQSRVNNDYKIMEVARDYGFILLTRDRSLCLQAETSGVESIIWAGRKNPEPARSNVKNKSDDRGNNELKPFLLPTSSCSELPIELLVKTLPIAGDFVSNITGQTLTLKSEINRGGEGVIYATDVEGIVCKIYHKNCLTQIRRKKIELMVSRRINREGLCWPLDISLNKFGEFVGYFMPKADGRPIQSTMFVKPVLVKTFPSWNRSDLVKVCQSFLRHIEFLHSMNIIVGDINPMNLLVTSDSSKLWIVDTDSFQIEDFSCPVGTVNFTAPEIQGIDYGEFLRTKEHEAFAVATMLFMILNPGKPPYSQQGGGSPGENIKNMEFPYGFKSETSSTSSRNAPQGPWFLIWNNFPYIIKECFHRTFRMNKRVSISEWKGIFSDYSQMLQRGHSTNDLFPSKVKVRDGIPSTCSKCQKVEDASRMWLDKLESERKDFLCGSCVDAIRIRNLAKKSQEATDQAMNGGCAPIIESTKISTSCTKCGQYDEADRYWLDKLQVEGKGFLCRSCVSEIRLNSSSKVAAICTKCQNTEDASPSWLNKLKSEERGFLCRNCVAEIRLNISSKVATTCTKCRNIEDASPTWLNKLKTDGKDFLCRSCVDVIRSKSRNTGLNTARVNKSSSTTVSYKSRSDQDAFGILGLFQSLFK